MNKHLKFEVDDIEVLELKGGDQALFGKETEDSQFATAKIRAFSSDWNRHNMYCSEEVLKKTAPTIFYKPLLYVIDKKMDDFGSHASPEESRPAGFVFPKGAELVRLGDGRLSLNVVVKIWKRYAPTVMSIFKRDNGKKAVSVEMELLDFSSNEDGSLDMLDFAYMAITILGDTIQEGSPGASIEILSFSDEVRQFKAAAKEEFSLNHDSNGYEIPREIKDNCLKGLSLYGTYGGADFQSTRTAAYLIGKDFIEPEMAYSIYSFFNSRKFNLENNFPSGDRVIYLLNGGTEGKKWIESVCLELEALKNQSFSSFEKITFPYDNKEEANSALKNWEPPLSLSQMNEIARQADAMIRSGKSEESAWKIAISNFKKTHKAENGKWVKKENMADKDLGTGEPLKLDKSKEAMSEKPWGEVDKTKLRNRVLQASNYKTLVKSVYMLIDEGWEDHPSESLHYPVMQIVNGDTLVYNRYGLAAALQRAKQHNEDGVVKKVSEIYKKLDLKLEKAEMNMEDNKIISKDEAVGLEQEPLEEKVEESIEEECVECEEKPEDNSEELMEEEPMEDMAEEEEEDSEEEEGDSEEDEDEEDEEVFNEKEILVDLESIFNILSVVEDVQGPLSEDQVDFAEIFQILVDENLSLREENSALKEFKEKIDQRDFDLEVAKTLDEILNKFDIPENEIDQMREEAGKFSKENLDQWKNQIKAKALDQFPLKKDEDDEGDVKRYGLSWPIRKKERSSSKWEKYLNKLDN